MKIKTLIGILVTFLLCHSTLGAQENIKWIDPLAEGAEVHGQGWPELRHTYFRLPDKAREMVNSTVWRLSRNSAGLSLVFRTDSPQICVRYQVLERRAMYHMPATGVSGIDLYATDSKGQRHFVVPRTPATFKDTISYNFTDIFDPVTRETGKEMTFRLNLPLYNTVTFLEIGIREGSSLEFLQCPEEKPVVIYGSSIVQGGCCSRPSMAWPSIVAANLGREVVNLGFSGSGKGEKECFDLISEIDAGVFVIDCLPNMKLDEPIKERLIYGIKKIRQTHDCPILLAEFTVCGQEGAIYARSTQQADAKNEILAEVYKELRKEGVKKLYYLSADQWSAGMDGYVEGDHPNDFGMMQLAAGATARLKSILRK